MAHTHIKQQFPQISVQCRCRTWWVRGGRVPQVGVYSPSRRNLCRKDTLVLVDSRVKVRDITKGPSDGSHLRRHTGGPLSYLAVVVVSVGCYRDSLGTPRLVFGRSWCGREEVSLPVPCGGWEVGFTEVGGVLWLRGSRAGR